jgi:hypothetical protein
MNRTIEIEFSEEAPVEIPALTISKQQLQSPGGACLNFWTGWQLFRRE